MLTKKILLAALLSCMYTAILQAQSVGIGTNSPNASAQLDITSTTKGMLIPRMTFLQRNAIVSPASGLLIYQIDFVSGFYYYNGSVWTQLSTGGASNYFTATGNNIYNNNTGDVGIGLTDPSEKLHIKGTTAIESPTTSGGAILKMFGGSSLSSIYFYDNSTSSFPRSFLAVSPGNTGYTQLAFNTNSLLINSDGLGINNSAPLTKLHILGGQDAGFSASGNGFIMNGSITGTNLVIDNNELLARNNGRKADLFLQADSGNVVLCANEQGAVGIGVTAGTSIPTGFLLAVDGKIISEEIKVQLSGNWPDYVFDEKYKLMPLNDLKKYLTINSHLPNIPAAAEIEKNGIEVGDMQKKITQTIEELTLYILELKNEIDLLKKQLSQNK